MFVTSTSCRRYIVLRTLPHTCSMPHVFNVYVVRTHHVLNVDGIQALQAIKVDVLQTVHVVKVGSLQTLHFVKVAVLQTSMLLASRFCRFPILILLGAYRL